MFHYLKILWKGKWMFLLAGVLGTLVSLWFILRTVPFYRAKASLEIQKVPQLFGRQVAVETSNDTQIRILTSRTLRNRALSVVPEPGAKTGRVVGPLVDLRKFLKMKDPASDINWRDSLAVAAVGVSVTSEKNGEILDIQTESPNPDAAAAFVNSLAEQFIKLTEEKKWETYVDTGAFLVPEQQRLKSEIEESEKKLIQFARENRLIFTDSPTVTSVDQAGGGNTSKVLQVKYDIMKRNLETNKELYDAMLQQRKQASIASAMRIGRVRIVDTALVQRTPVRPDLNSAIALGLLGGLCCGSAFIIVRSRVYS